MFEELVLASWCALGAYVFWYVAKAKEFQPLTLDDLALTWKLHKSQSGCKSSYIQDLLIRNNEVVGFKCECGHEFLQKRLITQKTKIATQSDTLFPFQDTSPTMENLSLPYLHIKKIQ